MTTKTMLTLPFAGILLFAAGAAHGNETAHPQARQHGPDLAFTCESTSGAVTLCKPQHTHYRRYMRLANWRFDGDDGSGGACRPGDNVGYTPQGPWVSGQCRARFVAPDLRFGDAHNPQRAQQAGAI